MTQKGRVFLVFSKTEWYQQIRTTPVEILDIKSVKSLEVNIKKTPFFRSYLNALPQLTEGKKVVGGKQIKR